MSCFSIILNRFSVGRTSGIRDSSAGSLVSDSNKSAFTRRSAANFLELLGGDGRMLECALLRPEPRGFSREPGQDHRHHDNRHSQHSVLWPFFRLIERQLLSFATILSL